MRISKSIYLTKIQVKEPEITQLRKKKKQPKSDKRTNKIRNRIEKIVRRRLTKTEPNQIIK